MDLGTAGRQAVTHRSPWWLIFGSKFIVLAAVAVIAWPVPAMTLSYASPDPKVFGRFSLGYFAFITIYIVGVVVWAGLTVWLAWWLIPSRLTNVRSHIEKRWASVLGGGILLLAVPLFGLRVVVDQTYDIFPLGFRQFGPELYFLLTWGLLLLMAGVRTSVPATHPSSHKLAIRKASFKGKDLTAQLVIFAPFLLSAYAVLYLFGNNLAELVFTDIVRSLVMTQLATLLLLGVMGLIFRDTTKAVFTSSIIVGIFFTYGHMLLLSDKILRLWLPDVTAASLSVAILAWAIMLASTPRNQEKLQRANTIIALVAAAFVAVALGQVGLNRLGFGQGVPPAYDLVVDIPDNGPSELPDIYYIILDGYSGNQTLLDEYGFDNSEFTDALEQRGFYVAHDSQFNYCSTFLALPTMLNMQYMDFLAEDPGIKSNNPSVPYRITDDSVVWRSLKPLGYKFIHFRTHHGATRENRLADLDLAPGDKLELRRGHGTDRNVPRMSEFELMLSNTTLLYSMSPALNERHERREAVSYIFNTLEQIPELDEPTYTFAHIASPHPPFLFDAGEGPEAPGGTPVDGEVVDVEKYEPNAAEMSQFIYVNRMTTQLVDQILAKSDTPPIIVIQADHGQRPGAPNSEFFDQGPDAVATYTLRILSAYYVPEEVKEHLYPSITPVNTFRVIFDNAFGTDLGLLEDRSICFSSRSTPYDFYEFD